MMPFKGKKQKEDSKQGQVKMEEFRGFASFGGGINEGSLLVLSCKCVAA